ncbi:extracellular solute-binding protein family 5 [Syntrophobotulus glycolicus DSM 8271]|uniref:Extracellular solute-binding protein family 5 n=1 Tax=Syntrophobotulus glycolicus (strain DSM 8271 / FlGlyR) TaxID=645991 RepID=F0SZM6_SYNGF|nr:ABC transporter substrate-binding protein [Syntrophobotulus glycolicus]ADY56112.1 extracellular solute-binding protein family 5 [Syntrophobotulus glycolicus DSM 8271]
MNKRMVSILLSLAVLFSFAGCQSQKQANREKSITVGESVAFASYDPIGIMDGQGFIRYSPLVYETLIRYENGEAKPCLAESWQNDGTTWTFHLKKDVSFTDGSPFNAETVQLNIEKLQEFVGDYFGYYGAVSRITSVQVMDESTVRFVYDAPYYAVLQELSASSFGLLSPKMFENGNNPYGSTLEDTAGTGPFELKAKNTIAGQSYTFTKNATWHGAESGPDSFTVKIIPDADSRMMALQSGEIDLLFGSYQITYDMLSQLESNSRLETIFSDNLYITRNILLNASGAVLSDHNVRKAIQHGIDKEQIIATVLHGEELKADTLFTKETPNCDVELNSYDYNPKQAISLLETSGWTKTNAQGIRIKEGQTLHLQAIYQSEKPVDEQILMALKGQLAEIGIDLSIQGYETMTWFEKGTLGEFDLSVNDTYGFPQDPHVFLTAMMDDGLDKTSQQGLSQKTEIDSHIANMMQTVDAAVIQEDYRYVLTTLHKEAVNVPVSYAKEMAIYNPEVISGITFDDRPFTLDVTRIVLNRGISWSKV